MLETPEERVKLLRKGIVGKTIEHLYIKHNGLKIVSTPINIEIIEIDVLSDNSCHGQYEEKKQKFAPCLFTRAL